MEYSTNPSAGKGHRSLRGGKKWPRVDTVSEEITVHDVLRVLRYPMNVAAARLGISTVKLLSICRRNGLHHWPSNQLVKIIKSSNDDEIDQVRHGLRAMDIRKADRRYRNTRRVLFDIQEEPEGVLEEETIVSDEFESKEEEVMEGNKAMESDEVGNHAPPAAATSY